MAKVKSVFVCQSCGTSYPKWQGQCDSCGSWNSLVEEVSQNTPKATKNNSNTVKTISLPEVEALSGPKSRFSTQIGELDRVLGGGIVPGAVMVLAGQPGIGKSTLLTQVVLELAQVQSQFETILYVAGEESPSQISLRINRYLENEQKNTKDSTGKDSPKIDPNKINFLPSTDVDAMISLIETQKPGLLIIDSINTLTTADLSGAAGSVGQIRECTNRVIEIVKKFNIPTFLVGHVTKEGELAGPKVLEHMVDGVLELSGERTGQLRLLRAIKNRFGATDEVGVFQIAEQGLIEVTNPTQFFLENTDKPVPGSVTVCVMEGTRPLLVEVQALVVSSQLAMPRRVGRGVELSRIQVLSAVLQKHAKLPLGNHDIFVSIAGGFAVKEPAVDLGIALAIAGSLNNTTLPQHSVAIGEIGLLGEIRKVAYLDRRIKEAKRLGYKNIYSSQEFNNIASVIKN